MRSWSELPGPTYDFGRPESGSEPSVVPKLTPAYPAPDKVLRETAHSGDERGVLAALDARDGRARLLLIAACGAIARDAIPKCARQQSSSPVNGLHRDISSWYCHRLRRWRRRRGAACDQHKQSRQHHDAHSSCSFPVSASSLQLSRRLTVVSTPSSFSHVFFPLTFFRTLCQDPRPRNCATRNWPRSYPRLSFIHHTEVRVQRGTREKGSVIDLVRDHVARWRRVRLDFGL